MGKIILYGVEASPPVRAVKMTLDALDLQYEFRVVNLLAGEHRTEEFMRKNPQHTVPTLEDDGHFIWDSHAIMVYLVVKYGKNDDLYPQQPLQRARVDQRLHFESGVLFQGCLRNMAYPLFHNNVTDVNRDKITAIYESFDFLECFLKNEPYMCGQNVTIADFSIISTVSSLVGVAPIDAQKHAKLFAWVERMKKWPNYQSTNGNGAQMLVDMMSSKIKRIID